MRNENYSINGKSSKITGWGASKFLEELDKSNKQIKFSTILIDNDQPLEEQSTIIAKNINKLKKCKNCEKIHVLGISKCGDMVVSMLKYLDNSNLEKLNIMAYSAPYLGTIFASPVILYKRLDDIIEKSSNKFFKKLISELKNKDWNIEERPNDLLSLTKYMHWKFFSQSHMDYDISVVDEEGVPQEQKERYDEKFLNEMFNEETLSKLRNIQFTNITTKCTEETLKNALITFNFNAVMLYLSSKIIFKDEPSDGMVTLKSSKYIEKVCKENNIDILSLTIENGHHDIATDSKIISKVIDTMVLYN